MIGALHNVDTSASGAGDEHDNVKSGSLVFGQDAPNFTASGEQRAAAGAIFDEKDAGAGRDEGARSGVAEDDAESAGVRRQQMHDEQQQHPEGQTAALAAAPETSTAQMEMTENDEQPTSAEPRVAAAAAPHKRRAVAAGTAVETGGKGGKPPAGDNGTWTTVKSRRARRMERARLDGTPSGATRKAAAARAAATWRTAATRRTAAAVIEYYSIE